MDLGFGVTLHLIKCGSWLLVALFWWLSNGNTKTTFSFWKLCHCIHDLCGLNRLASVTLWPSLYKELLVNPNFCETLLCLSSFSLKARWPTRLDSCFAAGGCVGYELITRATLFYKLVSTMRLVLAFMNVLLCRKCQSILDRKM